MDNDIKPLADAIYADKVRRARLAPPSKRMGWGAELFMESCQRMCAGIRAQFPGRTNAEVMDILRTRLGRLRQIQDHGIYSTAIDLP